MFFEDYAGYMKQPDKDEKPYCTAHGQVRREVCDAVERESSEIKYWDKQ